MSTVAQDVQQIREAIYGREVREAIADGIEHCYSDVSGGVTTANTAAAAANAAAQRANTAASGAEGIPGTASLEDVNKIKSALSQKYPTCNWRNGSVFNPYSTIAISTNYIIDTKNSPEFVFHCQVPLPAGCSYRYQFSTFSVSTGVANANRNNGVRIESTIVTNSTEFNVDLMDDEKGIAIALYIIDNKNNYLELNTNSVDLSNLYIELNPTFYERKTEKRVSLIDKSLSTQSIRYERGTFNADGTITRQNKNGVVSEIVRSPEEIYLGKNCRAVLALYDNATYLGKINSSGNVDKVLGDWMYFTDVIDCAMYSRKCHANNIRICILALSDIIWTDEAAQAWGENNAFFVSNVQTEQPASIGWIKGTFNAAGDISSDGNGAISSIIENVAEIHLHSDCRAVLALYDNATYLGKINSSGNVDKVSGDWMYFTNSINVSGFLTKYNANGALVCLVPNSGTPDVTNAEEYGETHCTIHKSKYITYEYAKEHLRSIGNKNNYIIRSDFLKDYLNVEYLGRLTYAQAFCVYNNKYYSIDGAHISEQDENFVELRNVDLNTGHGNTLQLGLNGKAYASGWNDQKLYIVDLNSLAIIRTIGLPTTGYTTCAYDELRDQIYIFQRDSYPDHEDNYNFIIYDAANETIISSRKILAFAAMQACDYMKDRIIVLNGLGSSSGPNGYRVFDIDGNIVAEYVLNQFSTIEPEGVCVDRGANDLYMSFVDRSLYKIYL